MTYQRPHMQLLKSRISERRKFIQVLSGPWQIGKATLVTQLLNRQGQKGARFGCI